MHLRTLQSLPSQVKGPHVGQLEDQLQNDVHRILAQLKTTGAAEDRTREGPIASNLGSHRFLWVA